MHELESWWPHPYDHQTTMYQCSCGYKTSGKLWIDNHVKESNG